MRALVMAAALAMRAAAADAASVEQFIGRPLAEVRIEIDGRSVADPQVAELVETRAGEPLSMLDVRDTIEHLVGLGRFADVRVFAEAAPAANGVVLRWALTPLRRIARIDLTGAAALSADEVRAAVADRLTGMLAASRQDAIVSLVRTYYADRGYRAARIEPRLAATSDASLVALVLDVTAGVRTTIGRVTFDGVPPPGVGAVASGAALVDALGVARGRPYDRPSVEDRLARYEDTLRTSGYYEASVTHSATLSTNESTADLRIAIQPGPMVRLVFEGDLLPSGERERLVPVRQERSVDQDLLEDASRNIEDYLRNLGYRSAAAPYTRVVRPAADARATDELLITFRVTRGPLHRVGGVSTRGASLLAPNELGPLLKLQAGDPFLDARVATISAALTESYRVRGFAQARVTPGVSVLPEESRSGIAYRPVDIRFDIVEGPRTLVGAVTFGGASAFAEDRLLALVSLLPGRPFYRPLLSADREALERAYRNAGYLAASVAVSAAPEGGDQSVSLQWAIAEGPLTLVDHILISGNLHTSASLIRREVTLRPGGPLGADAMLESQQRLSALGLFRRVRIVELPRSGSANRDVLVEVEEAPSTSVTEGGGIEVGRRLRSSDTGGPAEERIEVAPSGFFDITRRNLWGKNRSVSFFTRVALRPRDPAVDNPDPTDTGGYGFNEFRVLGTYREPRAFGTTGDAQLTGFVEQGVRASFNFNRKGVRADYARLIRPQVTTTVRYTFDYTKRFDEQIAPEDQLLIDRLFPQVRLSTFFGGILRDSRDDVLDPKKGAVIGIDGSLAARRLGSEVGFVKSFLQGFYYRQVSDRGYVVAVGGRLGLAAGFVRDLVQTDEDGNPILGPDGQPVVESVKDLPASERFFAGGDTTVRGFALDRLGTEETLDDQGFPQGGNGLALFNVELRAPYWKGLGLVGFIDSGNVFKFAGDIDLGALRVATGLGVRYRSPIGPLRVDVGFKLHPLLLESGGREKGYVVHISLGQAF